MPARTLTDVLDAVRAVDPTAWLHLPTGVDASTVLPSVERVTLASGEVTPGAVFAALPGARRHGAEFVPGARARGAVAVLGEHPEDLLPTLVVRDPQAVVGPLASWLHGDPSRSVAVHGVTGTNGKTSTARLLAACLTAAGRPTAWSTSLERATPSARSPATRTTPEAPAVQAFLAAARDDGARDAVVEASSHGLALHRLDGTHFRTGVFTNLSADHLDLHHDVESYFEAKASLFTPRRCGAAVVVVDDTWGRLLARRTACPAVTVSATGHPADWQVTEVDADLTGTRFRLRGPGVDATVGLRLLGTHQAVNAAAALAAAVTAGAEPHAALPGMADVVVAGRLERVEAGQDFPAFVDFAHNEGGHDRLLPYLRSLVAGRVVVVAGVTGERDVGKRARLGERIGSGADVVVVTDESPFSEDPRVLREALADGARRGGRALVLDEPDRATALARAVALTGPDDVLVVVGRGADPVRVSGTTTVAFDDRLELRRALAAVAPRPVV